jgi:hypothetical protein
VSSPYFPAAIPCLPLQPIQQQHRSNMSSQRASDRPTRGKLVKCQFLVQLRCWKFQLCFHLQLMQHCTQFLRTLIYFKNEHQSFWLSICAATWKQDLFAQVTKSIFFSLFLFSNALSSSSVRVSPSVSLLLVLPRCYPVVSIRAEAPLWWCRCSGFPGSTDVLSF